MKTRRAIRKSSMSPVRRRDVTVDFLSYPAQSSKKQHRERCQIIVQRVSKESALCQSIMRKTKLDKQKIILAKACPKITNIRKQKKSLECCL